MISNNPWDQINLPDEDISARRIDHEHPLDLFWARDSFGSYIFLFEFSAKPHEIKLPALNGVKVAHLTSQDRNRILLQLKDRSNWELFYTLCYDLVSATKNIKSEFDAVDTIIRRLTKWQELLKKDKSGLMSEEAIKGLIGELLFITSHLSPVFGIGNSVKFWQGPEGLAQDFNINDCAVEIKCQSGSSTPKVTISSINQLEPQLPLMFLHVVTLGKATTETPGVISLPSLISSIRRELEINAPESLERFNDLLYQTGYTEADYYLEYRYVPIKDSTYEVAEGFPRIRATEINKGILGVNYSINLSACEPYRKKPKWMEEVSI